jgi:hypothetical protein
MPDCFRQIHTLPATQTGVKAWGEYESGRWKSSAT